MRQGRGGPEWDQRSTELLEGFVLKNWYALVCVCAARWLSLHQYKYVFIPNRVRGSLKLAPRGGGPMAVPPEGGMPHAYGNIDIFLKNEHIV